MTISVVRSEKSKMLERFFAVKGPHFWFFKKTKKTKKHLTDHSLTIFFSWIHNIIKAYII